MEAFHQGDERRPAVDVARMEAEWKASARKLSAQRDQEDREYEEARDQGSRIRLRGPNSEALAG